MTHAIECGCGFCDAIEKADPKWEEGQELSRVFWETVIRAFKKNTRVLRLVFEEFRLLAKDNPTFNIISAIDDLPYIAASDPFLATWERVAAKVVVASGQKEIKNLGFEMVFNLQNPKVQEWVISRGGISITGINNGTRAGINTIVADGISHGTGIPAMARQLRDLVGLTPRMGKAVLRRERRLTEAGIAGPKLERNTARYARKLINVRARNIARTETIAARAQGQLAVWEEALEDGLLTHRSLKTWINNPASPRCPICEGLDAAEPIPIGSVWYSEFVGPVGQPPAHPSCRCSIALVTKT